MHDGNSKIRLNFRHAALLSAILFSVFLLWKVVNEQEKIERCTSSTGVDKSSSADDKRPIQVIIQNPFTANKTSASQIHDKPAAQLEPEKWDYNWDRKQWKNKSEAIGVPARTIVLVRHGRYHYNTGLLDDLGKTQANYTGARLKHMGMKLSRIVHSTMNRARETAEIIHQYFPDVPMEKDSMMEEGGPVPPEPTISYWGLPERTYHVDGPRLESAFRKYFHRADKSQTQQSYELLVGHANIFRFFILRALQLERSGWMRIFLPHASISLLHINSDGTVSATRFGDSGHMPNDMVTF